ncbi:hypothetical protein K7432_014004 [Basidiobolus ranarum]|uniref:Uncharacterized protein n=1 Tax=Basidiobolus ranarum TaxID=34480 RepID=A0ABR2WI98_9FUNG
MLYVAGRSKKQPSNVSSESYLFDSDPKWFKYLAKLKEYNYFQGELEGSLLYRELEKMAKEQYFNMLTSSTESDADSHVQEQIDQVLDLPLPEDSVLISNETTDDDSWMNLDEQQLEELLNNRGGMSQGSQTQPEEEVNLANIIDQFKGFVAHESGVDGVEFPDEFSSDEELDSEDEEENSNVEFDPSAFLKILKDTLGIDDIEPTLNQQSSLPKQPAKASDTKTSRPKQVRFSGEETSDLPESDDPKIEDIMEFMDEELSTTKLGKSFLASNITDQENEFKPVDVDFNLVQNLLESFKSQQGLPGPAGNILSSMGLGLPRDEEE